jgi:hypothetical protein
MALADQRVVQGSQKRQSKVINVLKDRSKGREDGTKDNSRGAEGGA